MPVVAQSGPVEATKIYATRPAGVDQRELRQQLSRLARRGRVTERDERLLEYLREHEIHLEVCPSCNVYVDHRRFEAYGDHPVGALYDAGISISVSTPPKLGAM